jgi:integrase
VPTRVSGLTARRVQTIAKAGLYADGGGLYLQVGAAGAKSWILRYQLAGRRRDMGLGSAELFTLAETREKAIEARRLIAIGIDPIEARRIERNKGKIAAAAAITFQECAARYIAAHRAGWRSPKSLNAWEATLGTYVYPTFGDVPVQAVDTGLVTKAIEPIWPVIPETAGRVRGRIESILDYASVNGWRQGENPARWRGHLEKLLPRKSSVRPVEHHPALPYGEIAEFMIELRRREGIAARAFEFLILTAARTGEVIGARWSEIDHAAKLWTIPGERMKGRREHRVPLSNAALAILDAMTEIRQGDFVFPGGNANRPLSNMSLLMTLRRMGHPDLTAHGFRSTFRDWCAERTNFPAEVAEMALAHTVGDKVEAAYRRGDLFEKRRDLAEAWARFCEGATQGVVVPLHSVAKIG